MRAARYGWGGMRLPMTSAQTLDTPVVTIDLDVVEANNTRLQAYLRRQQPARHGDDDAGTPCGGGVGGGRPRQDPLIPGRSPRLTRLSHLCYSWPHPAG